MKIQVLNKRDYALSDEEACLVLPCFEGNPLQESSLLTDSLNAALQKLAGRGVIRGKAQACVYLPVTEGPIAGVLSLGLGKEKECDAEELRCAAGKACATLKANRITRVVFDGSGLAVPPDAFAEGIILGQYHFDLYKKQKAEETPPVEVTDLTIVAGNDTDAAALEESVTLAAIMAVSANIARDFAHTGANEMTPDTLAALALGLSKRGTCACRVLDEGEMEALGMNALLGVARGSSRPPRLIVLEYRHEAAATTAMIAGKGITFDAGGISIKPSSNMHEMKYDMCGAAAVLGVMSFISEVRPAINVIAVIPAAENKTGASAQTPGDIVTAYNGKTIEVRNTDAEGRLILADAMAWALKEYQPDCLIDLATLTGACVVALGHDAAGLFGTDDALIEGIEAAAEKTGERVWRMPLWKTYCKLIEGEHADLSNIGPPGEAGAITAAAFLKEFTGDTPWAHIDIAGTAWGAKNLPWLDKKYASGWGVRLLCRWLLDRAEQS
jgi:leucyl aminopeptidase